MKLTVAFKFQRVFIEHKRLGFEECGVCAAFDPSSPCLSSKSNLTHNALLKMKIIFLTHLYLQQLKRLTPMSAV